MPSQTEGTQTAIGLALSGGGFRASLFHLGVLKRLWEVGLLPGATPKPWNPGQITHLSSVSGGSITAALYCCMLPQEGNTFSFREFERELLAGVKKNLRMRWVFSRFGLLVILVGAAAWAFWVYLPLFGQWWRIPALLAIAAVLYYLLRSRRVMARLYRHHFYSGFNLSQLPDFPRLIVDATSLNSGSGFFFTRDYVGRDPAQAFAGGNQAPESRLADAVGASAAVPGIFAPFRLPRHGYLVDGGVWDNQGLSVYFSDPGDPAGAQTERVRYLIASDASATLALSSIPTGRPPYKPFPFLDRIGILSRSVTITGDTARKWLYEMLLHKWTYRRLDQFAAFHTLSKQYDPDYTVPMPEQFIPLLAGIRTDLDSFSDLEIRALMYHGYSLANYRIFSHCWGVLGPTLGAAVIGAKRTLPALGDLNFNRVEDLDRDDLNRFIAAPLQWNEFLGAISGNLPLPPMKTWKEFNKELDNEVGTVLRHARWKEFGQNPTDPELYAAALRHLKYSGTNSIVLRSIQRFFASP